MRWARVLRARGLRSTGRRSTGGSPVPCRLQGPSRRLRRRSDRGPIRSSPTVEGRRDPPGPWRIRKETRGTRGRDGIETGESRLHVDEGTIPSIRDRSDGRADRDRVLREPLTMARTRVSGRRRPADGEPLRRPRDGTATRRGGVRGLGHGSPSTQSDNGWGWCPLPSIGRSEPTYLVTRSSGSDGSIRRVLGRSFINRGQVLWVLLW